MPGSTAPSAGGIWTSVGSSPAGGASGDASGGGTLSPGVMPPGAVSTAMIGVPTSTVVPSATRSSVTTPAYGDGSSTRDFAVSISTIGSLTLTLSPGLTRHVTISASVRPSPASGRRKCWTLAMAPPSSVGQHAVDGVEHAVEIRQVLLLDPARRVRRVEPADPQYRSLEAVEAPLGHPGGDLRAEPEEHRRLVHGDQPARPLHRPHQGHHVERGQRPQVDDLDAGAVGLGGGGGLQRGLDHRPVRGDRHLRARPDDARLVQPGLRAGRRVELALLPVPPLGLEEEDGIVAGDRLLDHPVGVRGVGARDDAEPGSVREVGLRALAVVLDRADTAAEGHPDDDRELDRPARPVRHLRQLADDLVVGRVDEPVELDLADRPVTAQRQADRGADDAALGERGVDDPVLAEVLLQPVGDPEDTAELADVLAHDEDLRVVLHRRAQAGVDGLGDRRLAHRAPPEEATCSPAKLAWYSANQARSCSTRGCGSRYAKANMSSGSGSGMVRHSLRTCAASSSASRSTCSKNAASPRPLRDSRALTLAIGSLSFHSSTSAAIRYRVGSSEVVCAPIR